VGQGGELVRHHEEERPERNVRRWLCVLSASSSNLLDTGQRLRLPTPRGLAGMFTRSDRVHTNRGSGAVPRYQRRRSAGLPERES
jgi:hypothetical protein